MIPNLTKKEPIPNQLPKELEQKIKEFSKNSTKEEYLERCFYYLSNKWKGSRVNLLLQFPKLFQRDVNKMFNTKGYQHCTNINYILRIMLVKSNKFKDSDIELKLTHSWFLSPHQYLDVKVANNKKLHVDPWNYQFGIDLGDFGKGFKSKHIFPIR